MTAHKPPAILIVEDERIIARDLQQTLSGMGYDAFAIAASAEQALARAAEERPDLVLIDIRIKGERDGITTAEMLRTQFGASIIYLTAHSDEITIERTKKTAPDGYLTKPVKVRDLKEAIEIAVRKRSLPTTPS